MRLNNKHVVGLVLVSFGLGLSITPAHSALVKQMAKFRMTYELVSEKFYQPINQEKLLESAVNGLIKELKDPYSYYLTPSEYAQFEAEKEGEVIGVGVELAIRNGELTVVSVREGSPAAKAEIQSGDIIRKIANQDTLNLSFAQALNLLTGKIGSTVDLHIARPEERKDFERKLTRTALKLENLSSKLLTPEIGYIKLNSFVSEESGTQMKAALKSFEQKNLKGLILDLRDNPGGLVPQAQEIGSLFMKDSVLVKIVNRYGRETVVKAHGDAIFPAAIPMVVLINQGSASASEILAASLQENKRATLLGTTSFGKALVQELVPLNNGGGLSLSVSRYLTSKGVDIHGKGVKPDIQVAQKGSEDSQLKAAIGFLQR